MVPPAGTAQKARKAGSATVTTKKQATRAVAGKHPQRAKSTQSHKSPATLKSRAHEIFKVLSTAGMSRLSR